MNIDVAPVDAFYVMNLRPSKKQLQNKLLAIRYQIMQPRTESRLGLVLRSSRHLCSIFFERPAQS